MEIDKACGVDGRPGRRALVWFAAGAALVAPLSAHAAPCSVAGVASAEVERAVVAWLRPPAPPAPPSRLWALLPARMQVGVRTGVHEGTGVYIGASGGPSERWLASTDLGWQVRFDWDLRELWRPHAVARPPSVGAGVQGEQLAARLARHVAQVRRIRAEAAELEDGDPACTAAQIEAEAAVFVVRAMVRASPATSGGSHVRADETAGLAAPPAPTTMAGSSDSAGFASSAGFDEPAGLDESAGFEERAGSAPSAMASDEP